MSECENCNGNGTVFNAGYCCESCGGDKWLPCEECNPDGDITPLDNM